MTPQDELASIIADTRLLLKKESNDVLASSKESHDFFFTKTIATSTGEKISNEPPQNAIKNVEKKSQKKLNPFKIEEKELLQEDNQFSDIEISLSKAFPGFSDKDLFAELQRENSQLGICHDLSETEVFVIECKSTLEEKKVLENLTKAVNKKIKKSFLIDIESIQNKENRLKLFKTAVSAKLIVVSESTFYQIKDYEELYQCMPKRTFCNIDLFFLADLKAYLEEPKLKIHLWQALQNELK